MTSRHLVRCLIAASIVFAVVHDAEAHGLVGQRFFPATLATDDPFVADELSLPTLFHLTRETDVSGEFSKRLGPNLGIGLGGTWKILDPAGSPTITGFDNLEVTLKYTVFKSEAHETLLSVGLGWDVGGTGAKRSARSPSIQSRRVSSGARGSAISPTRSNSPSRSR
ncbi:MAG: hypothetical protein HY216_13195 [Candidatus Rokubacteria bacterium]|nr:hypothetical protein [Candidatus Rokubacteria bacterium]